MCRYSFNSYKSHYACFTCRKTFKHIHEIDRLDRIGKADYYEKLARKPKGGLTDKEAAQLDQMSNISRSPKVRCPECGGYMADLGLDFKSPKKTALKEWKIIEGLYAIGKTFYGCGCTGMGYIPTKPKDYQLYLAKTLAEYERSIAHFQSIPLEERKDKAKCIRYWSDKAAAVRQEIARQTLAT